MNIKFKNSENIELANFIISPTLEVRINETTNTVIFKLRNQNYQNTGRLITVKDVESITNVVLDNGDEYKNLMYSSHEIYIHNINNSMIEDLVITFSKSVDIL